MLDFRKVLNVYTYRTIFISGQHVFMFLGSQMMNFKFSLIGNYCIYRAVSKEMDPSLISMVYNSFSDILKFIYSREKAIDIQKKRKQRLPDCCFRVCNQSGTPSQWLGVNELTHLHRLSYVHWLEGRNLSTLMWNSGTINSV